MRTPLDDLVAGEIRRRGPLPFGEVMGTALYHAVHGFYSTGGAAGRRGDFITSPEVGPLFGAVLARALDAWWRELGEPEPFLVVEAAAGVGTLARTILAAAPDCLAALTYVLVEQSPALRARQGDHLRLVDPPFALTPAGAAGGADGERPVFVGLGELPTGPFTGVVVANELLDNLPVDLLERVGDQWHEVRVGLADDDLTLVELLVPAPDVLARRALALAPEAAPGARIPVAAVAADWVRRAYASLDRGRLLLVDYGASTAALAARPATEWLRTYRHHERGGPPLEALGSQDITCEVPFDQLPRLGEATITPQADFLRAWGIDDLVEAGRRTWNERAHIGDLAAIKARSRVREAEALLDPAGLGTFRVLLASVPSGH